MVGYTGYRVPPDGSGTVDVVQAQDLDARTLWSKYIALRKPVLIKGHLTDAGWKASAKWDDAYLSKMAGSSPLQIEKRDGPGSSYGQGRKQSMTLAQFLQRMAAGDDTLYLTTQQVGLGPDGHPDLMGHPLLALQDDFELRPSIAGNLVPQQINLWMGRATDGASSGLHHDFHDNLYILMRGRKKFKLWDPSNAPRMYTEGKVRSVHANGRIVYEGQGDVLPDGSSAQDVALWHARQAAEKEVAAAELAVKRGEAGAARRLKEAEQQLEDVLEQELDQALEEGEDMEEDSEEEEEEEEEEEARGKGKGAKQNGGAGKQGPKGKGAGETRDEGNPPSFCRVQPAGMAAAALAKKFPDFPGAQAALECEVEAGSMLYLPAGWFHEVTSFSGNGSGDAAAAAAAGASTRSRKAAGAAKAQDAGPDGGHMALNYWFHPPDNLDPSYQGFSKPYLSGYWSSLWRERTGEAAGEEEEEEGREEGAAVLDDKHRPFEGVHVDEPEGGTGHTLKIEELVQQIDRDLKEGSKRRAGAGGKRARDDDAEEEALAGKQGGAKKRSGVGRGADDEDEDEDEEGEEEEEDEDEEEEEEEKAGPIVLKGRERGPGGVSIVGMEGMNEAQRKEVHDQIKAMLMQGLLAQAQRGLEGPKQRLREFRPPLGGRRHHAVMFVPRPPRKE